MLKGINIKNIFKILRLYRNNHLNDQNQFEENNFKNLQSKVHDIVIIETKTNQDNNIKPHIKVFDLQPKSKKAFLLIFPFYIDLS